MIIRSLILPALLTLTALLVPATANGQPSRVAAGFSGDPAAFATPYADTLRAVDCLYVGSVTDSKNDETGAWKSDLMDTVSG